MSQITVRWETLIGLLLLFQTMTSTVVEMLVKITMMTMTGFVMLLPLQEFGLVRRLLLKLTFARRVLFLSFQPYRMIKTTMVVKMSPKTMTMTTMGSLISMMTAPSMLARVI